MSLSLTYFSLTQVITKRGLWCVRAEKCRPLTVRKQQHMSIAQFQSGTQDQIAPPCLAFHHLFKSQGFVFFFQVCG